MTGMFACCVDCRHFILHRIAGNQTKASLYECTYLLIRFVRYYPTRNHASYAFGRRLIIEFPFRIHFLRANSFVKGLLVITPPTHTHTHTHACTYSRAQRVADSYSETHPHTHTRTHTHTHTHTHTRTHTYTHIHIHTHTHAHTHTHTHTHTHIHTHT